MNKRKKLSKAALRRLEEQRGRPLIDGPRKMATYSQTDADAQYNGEEFNDGSGMCPPDWKENIQS